MHMFNIDSDTNKLSDINTRMQTDDNNKYSNSENNAMDILDVVDSLQHKAISILEYLITYKYAVFEETTYTELFSYYQSQEEWNLGVIEELIKQETYRQLPKLNYFCENNMKFLILMLIKAIETEIDDSLDNKTIDESINSANFYFDIIRKNCPEDDKESCEQNIQRIKEKLANVYADYVEREKLNEYDELREEHNNNHYIEECDLILDFEPNNEKAKNLKIYFLEQKIEDIRNGTDVE